MAQKARHAFGMLENIDDAIANSTIDAYDILFVKDANGKPYVGWIDKDGNKVICESENVDLSGIESEIANIGSEVATKADITEVDEKVNQAVTDSVASAKSYTDGRVEAAISEHLVKKYEITSKPEGTLVDYRDKEIRVMCPTDTQFELQNSGEGADANKYYIGFKAYAPEDAVSFKEDLAEIIADETMYYFEGNDFAGIDKNGRKYSIVWLPVAKYDEATGTWTYYGANSSSERYIGWYYSVEFYNSEGMMILSDTIRINLSNENCHSSIEPYYVGNMMKEIDTKIESKIAEVNSSYEIVEF